MAYCVISVSKDLKNIFVWFLDPVNYNEWKFCENDNECPEGLRICQPREIATNGKFDTFLDISTGFKNLPLLTLIQRFVPI